MFGTKWYSMKHNTWATVSDEKPMSKGGYYLIKFDSGIYRYYNAERINREVAEFGNLNIQLDAQLMPMQYKVGRGSGTTFITSVGEINSEAVVNVLESQQANKDVLPLVVINPTRHMKNKPQKNGKLIGLVFE